MRSLEYTTLLEHGSRHIFPYLCPLGKSRLLQPLTSHIFSFRRRYIPGRYHRVTRDPGKNPCLRPDILSWVKTAELRRLAKVINLAVSLAAVAFSLGNPRRTPTTNNLRVICSAWVRTMLSFYGLRCEASAHYNPRGLVRVTVQSRSRMAHRFCRRYPSATILDIDKSSRASWQALQFDAIRCFSLHEAVCAM